MTNVLNASVLAKKGNFLVVAINNLHCYLVTELCRCFSVEVLMPPGKADLNETWTGFSTSTGNSQYSNSHRKCFLALNKANV